MPAVAASTRDELIWNRATHPLARYLSPRGRAPQGSVGGATDTGKAEIYLSKTSFVHGGAGVVVGVLSVRSFTPGPYTVSIQGTDGTKFTVDALGNLVTATTVAAGTYNIDIVINVPASLNPSKRSFVITAT
jgi:hypothetical protein